MVGIIPTDTILIPSSSPTGRALVQRGSDILVLSNCCLSTYNMMEESHNEHSIGYEYICVGCGSVSKANARCWIPYISDASVEKLSDIASVTWADWVKYWFEFDNVEVEIS